MRIVLSVALFFASATQVGCGSESGSSPGGSSQGGSSQGGSSPGDSEAHSLAPADDTYLTDFCTLTTACCGKNGRSSDIAACKARSVANGFSQDRALQSQCLTEVEGLKAAAGPSCAPEVWDLAGACSRVAYEPNGTLEPGQPCTSSADCAGEAGSITLCVVVCIRMARGKAGDGTCMGDVSEEGIIVSAPVSQVPPLPPISTGVLCERRAGLYCSFAEDKALQTCAPLKAGGASCAYSRTCATERCYNGDNTSGDPIGTCISLVPAGQACPSDVPTTDCDAASYCETNGGTTAGVCAAKSPGGSSCNADYQCLNGECTNGICNSTTDAQEIALLAACGF